LKVGGNVGENDYPCFCICVTKVFDELRKINPELLNKIRFINGDISDEDLGITSEERSELIKTVNVVFHCAALVSFDLPLFDILKVNVKGTQRLLELTKEMKNLKAFTFVSTAFSQSYQEELKEMHYQTGYDISTIMKWIDADEKIKVKEVEIT
jgi:thioester reductase-like protein